MTEHDVIELGKVAGAIIALATLTGLTWKVTRTMIRTMRKLGRLADEIMGDGDQRPGWGRRLTKIETDLTKIETDVADLRSEVRPNGGGSMRDQISRIETATGAKKGRS